MMDPAVFLTQYGAMVLFVVVFVKQLGLPFPAVPILLAAGALAGTGHMSLVLAVGITMLAATAADWIWYEIGRRRGRQVLGWICRITLEPDACVRNTEAMFAKQGPRSVVLAKFIPGLSTIAPPLAGIVGLGLPLFLFYDGLGALLWTGSTVGIGYIFSGQIEEGFFYAAQFTPAVILTTLAALIAYLPYKYLHARRQHRRVPRITATELAEELKAAEPPVLIDVRRRGTPESEPRLPDAVLMALDELPRRHLELPRHRALVLYCSCPDDAASAHAALVLQKLGFTRVRALRGGVEAWHTHLADGTQGSRPPVPTEATYQPPQQAVYSSLPSSSF